MNYEPKEPTTPQVDEKILRTYNTLKNSEELFVIISMVTKLPFVRCNPETYDDEILLFTNPDEAKKAVDGLLEEKYPLQLSRLANEQFRFFYTALSTMGINALRLDWNTEKESQLQLNQLIRRPEMPKEKAPIENPQLFLPALYLLQDIRRQPAPEMNEQLNELNEEMLAAFRKGTYLIQHSEIEPVKLLKAPDGMQYFPVFTDALEFTKYNQKQPFQPKVVTFAELASVFETAQADGAVLNPASINLPLKLFKK